jgi:hypothetical protein
MKLWKYNRITGLWDFQRAVSPETADSWLAVFQKDQPQEYFRVSKNKPSQAPLIGNPSPGRSAIKMYQDFHQHEPRKIGSFGPRFEIPHVVRLAGPAVNVLYRSDKVDPETGRMPKGPLDYIHDHDSGVNVYRVDTDCDGLDKSVPAFIRDVKDLVLLGDCLGFSYRDEDGAVIEASSTRPFPELYTIPSGRALLVVQGKRKVLAIAWGGRLGVEARGIVH